MSMAIIGAVIAAGTAAYGVAEGANQKRRARHKIEELERSKPVETMPEEIKRSQDMANLMAKKGLPSEQYNMAQKNIARQQQRALRGAADRKMGLAMLPYLDDNANRAMEKLDANNANARRENQRTLLDVNTQVGNWKKGIFDRNVREPWNRSYEYNMALKGQGNQNISNSIVSGLNAVGAIAGAAKGGDNSNNWATSLFGGYRRRGAIGGSGGDPNGGNLRLDDYGNLI